MVFADLNLSRRLERAEGHAARQFAESRLRHDPASGATWIECAGAYAVFDGPDSPVTQTFGLGLFEEPATATFDTIERFFLDRGAPVMHEVSPLAGVPTISLLCDRGYRPVEISSVLHQPVYPPHPESDGAITVHPIEAADAPLWADISARGWSSAHPELEESIRQFGVLLSAREDTVCFLATLEGHPAAAAALCLHEDVALFAGAATLPEMRRRGLQAALLRARMRYAYDHHFTLAMMVTEAGSQSQRNAERAAFRIAYTRTKWRLSQCR